MNQFRELIYVALASGTVAGVLLFAVRHFTIFPLIEKAEIYESTAEGSAPYYHEDEDWKPAEGFDGPLLPCSPQL